MIRVQTPAVFTERLNQASATRRCYPWDRSVIDWTVPIDDTHLYMPEAHSIFAGTQAWRALSPAAQSFLTRWEFTQFMRNAGAGEHLLNQAILGVLQHTDPYDPAWRYLLHETAEECQHMAMFNTWIRLNPDIRTRGIGQDRWGLAASMLTPLVATRIPVFFWTMTMLLEVFGDTLSEDQARNSGGRLHPIVEQIGRAHRTEEARHIAFAREWMATAVPKMSKRQRGLLAETAERTLTFILKRGVPIIGYSRQLAPYVSYEDFHRALRSERRRDLVRRQAGPTIEILHELGIVRHRALRRWDREGLLPLAA